MLEKLSGTVAQLFGMKMPIRMVVLQNTKYRWERALNTATHHIDMNFKIVLGAHSFSPKCTDSLNFSYFLLL